MLSNIIHRIKFLFSKEYRTACVVIWGVNPNKNADIGVVTITSFKNEP